MWWKSLFIDTAKKIASNVSDLVTSKTTWATVGGIILDAVTLGGGKPTKASLMLIGGKIIQQAAADLGKNAKK